MNTITITKEIDLDDLYFDTDVCLSETRCCAFEEFTGLDRFQKDGVEVETHDGDAVTIDLTQQLELLFRNVAAANIIFTFKRNPNNPEVDHKFVLDVLETIPGCHVTPEFFNTGTGNYITVVICPVEPVL